MNRSPVIVIGAPRSGTNMLRDVLCDVEGLDTWPCDEINYIWRYGNRDVAHDAFEAEMADSKTAKYLHERFEAIRQQRRCRRVVEKTCANSLRVPFVDRIFPDAKFVFIVRNGLDVVFSARERRRAPLAPAYLYAKARYVPVKDLPYYAWRYALGRVDRLRGQEKVVRRWGPAPATSLPKEIESTALTDSAHQWRECVRSSERAFRKIPPDRVHRLNYEAFVQEPVEQTQRILAFLDERWSPRLDQRMFQISPNGRGKGCAALHSAEIAKLEPLLRDTMEECGYIWPEH